MKERISKIKNKSSVLNSNNWTLDPWIYPCITVHYQFIATQALQLDFQNCTACLKSNFQLSKKFSDPCPSWAFITGFTSLHVLDLLKHSFMSSTRLSLNTLACESCLKYWGQNMQQLFQKLCSSKCIVAKLQQLYQARCKLELF